MLRMKLFDGKPTIAQSAIVGFWALNLGLVLMLWITTTQFSGGTAIILNTIGLLFGLLATYFALTQFMLMGRIAWIERHFGLDHLASYHRINGYLAIICILIHPISITISYALNAHVNLLHEYIDLLLHFSYVWLALIAQILFIAVVVTSIYIVRKRLKFESWYFVHLAVYAAIVIVPFHQLAVGGSFVGNGHPLARMYWLGLYAFVAVNVLFWRFSVATFNFIRFGFRIDRVVSETPTTTSVYIRGRGLDKWHTKAGQFVLVRIFAKGFWWQEHPFSLSWLPHDNLLRITIRHVGDYTDAVAKLQPGKRVLVAGPFGRFTSEVAQTNKRLFIAGGVGITPIRSLAEEAINQKFDSILLYGNRSPDDVVFEAELNSLVKQGLKTTIVYSNPPALYPGETGYIDGERIVRLAPDYKKRDIYLCGPPVMMKGVIESLLQRGVNPERLHYERFTLHS